MSARISAEDEASVQLRARVRRVAGATQRLLDLPDGHEPDDCTEVAQLLAYVQERLQEADGVGAVVLESAERHAQELESLRDRFQSRLDALKRAERAAAELRKVTSPEGILRQAPQQLSESSALERVVLSRVLGGRLVAEAAFFRDDPLGSATALAALRAHPPRLEHPLIETELLRRRRATLVTRSLAARTHGATAQVMGWSAYIAAPLIVAGEVIGAIHGDVRGVRELDVRDGDVLWTFARNLAEVYEFASLRRTLRRHRERSRQFIEWLGARSAELSDTSMQLSTDSEPSPDPPDTDNASVAAEGVDDRTAFADLLSRRELDVLRLLARGATNGSIAAQLVISESTVKFHVVNILRKLHVSNRSAAVARYHRLVQSPRSDS